MNFQADRKALLKALRTVSAIIPWKSSRPASEGVLIEAFEDYLLLTCTDLVAEIAVKVPAVVVEPGFLCTPAKALANILKARPGDTTLLFDGKLDDIPVEEIELPPTLSPIGDPLHFTLPNTAGVRYAMGFNESRHMLNGLCVELGESGSRMVASDGFRLALTAISGTDEAPRQVIIPQQIVRLLPKDEVEATLYDEHIVLVHGDTAWATKLIDGRYMNVDSVLKPLKHPICSITVPKYVLLDTAQQEVALRGKDPIVTLAFAAGSFSATLAQGLAQHAPCDYAGKPQKAIFGAKLLLECVKVLQDPIVIDVQEDQCNTPLVIRQGNAVHLLMVRYR